MVVVFLAVLVQAATGFGLALVSMPLLTAVLGLPTAAPLMAIVGLGVEFVLLLHFRAAVNLVAVRGLVLAAFIGTPVGLYLLRVVDPAVGARVLGLLVAGYTAYTLVIGLALGDRLPTAIFRKSVLTLLLLAGLQLLLF